MLIKVTCSIPAPTNTTSTTIIFYEILKKFLDPTFVICSQVVPLCFYLKGATHTEQRSLLF